MTQKQYEDMRTIMQFGRLFADAMRRAMINAGLTGQDFSLGVDVKNEDIGSKDNLVCTVELMKNPCRNDDYMESRMADFRFEKGGWEVVTDPVVKSGIVPPEVRTTETAFRIYESRTEVQKESPPDGLWISKFDDPYPVDLWE